MVDLRVGDIILVRGRTLRYKFARFILRHKWNHVVIYLGNDKIQELNWNGTQRKSFSKYYQGRQIIVLRIQSIGTLVSVRRDAAFGDALNKLRNLRFDWVDYLRRIILLKSRNIPDRCLCDEYINRVYREAHKSFDKGDFIMKVDCVDLIKKDYSDTILLRRHNLIKVHDSRWT